MPHIRPHNTPSKRLWIRVVLLLIGLISVCLINYWLFRRLFGSNYLRWYVSAGPFIGLATAAFAAAWGKLDNNTGLVSAIPLDYIGACLQTAGLPIVAFGGHPQSKYQLRKVPGWDHLFGLPLVLAFVIAALAWLLLIAPLQYFVFLICGAPSRMAMTSKYRLYARLDDWKVKYEERTVNDPPPTNDPPPAKEWWDASMADKPVTLANAFSAATLFLVGWFWS
jgi:hypothetical protein